MWYRYSYIIFLIFIYIKGSLLYLCSEFGAYTIGTDINKKVLKGIGKKILYIYLKLILVDLEHSIYSNFKQYNITNKFIDLIVKIIYKYFI